MKNVSHYEESARIKLAGEDALLLPQKAMFLPACKTLVVADVHIGKGASFRSRTFFAPDGMTSRDLNCLSKLIQKFKAERLIVLGDLVHAQDGLTKDETALFDQFRQSHADMSMVLIMGNHDRRSRLPRSWHMERVMGDLHEGPFIFSHEYAQESDEKSASSKGYVLSGHIHPSVVLYGQGKQRERLPCFWLRRKYAVLPSFGVFTGSFTIRPSQLDKIFVVAHDAVIPMIR
ncbi:MAG: ligase-associated DNA damage response endonuclease PdeM [Cyanobacteria bacterium SZAS LIN-2]|nr:ligase-associated DNA damage response endonuclease PdeM [Cyanobacteria bacterium SZAS LIN-2]